MIKKCYRHEGQRPIVVTTSDAEQEARTGHGRESWYRRGHFLRWRFGSWNKNREWRHIFKQSKTIDLYLSLSDSFSLLIKIKIKSIFRGNYSKVKWIQFAFLSREVYLTSWNSSCWMWRAGWVPENTAEWSGKPKSWPSRGQKTATSKIVSKYFWAWYLTNSQFKIHLYFQILWLSLHFCNKEDKTA